MPRLFHTVIAAACLVLGLTSGAAFAVAPKTYTWTLVESSTVWKKWPNELNSANPFESDGGLLGRILSLTDETTTNACNLAESHPCASGEPPVFMFPAGSTEGPVNGGGLIECNRKVNACSDGFDIPGVHGGHAGGNTPNESPIGEFSYFVQTRPGGARSMSFIAGSYVTRTDPFICNSCPPEGSGKDIDSAAALVNARITALTQVVGESLWSTQYTDGLGETGHVSLALAQSGAGQISGCGEGVQFETLVLDICMDNLPYNAPLHWSVKTYSVNQAGHASLASPGRCDGPDCYVKSVIIPAALAQSSAAKNVQVRRASTVLPTGFPYDNFGIGNATMDFLIFGYTTQLVDQDGDLIEDRVDLCPNDEINECQQNFGPGPCPAGKVFCADAFGDFLCLDPFLCNQQIDINQDCSADANDFNDIGGVLNGTQGTEAFGFGLPTGPFNP